MRFNLDEPVTLPRWVLLTFSLAIVIMGSTGLLQMSERVSYPPFVVPLLVALLLAAMLAGCIVLGFVITRRLTGARRK